MRYLLFLMIVFISSISSAKCKAILVNGGANPFNNYTIHETQIREMYKTLTAQGCQDEDIYVFSASGKAGAKDFRIDPINTNSEYRSFDYKFDGENRVHNLLPADKQTLKSKMNEIMKSASPDDKVFIYMSDHGNSTMQGKGLVPWLKDGTELFTTEDLEEALAAAPKKTKVNIWADCCFCGTFNKVKRSNTCIATSTDEYHVGNYFWDKFGVAGVTKNSSVKAKFAGEINANDIPTLGKAAQSAKLNANDPSYIKGMMANGCFLGPRTSAEQYAFDTIGFGDKPLCESDLEKIYDIQVKSKSDNSCVDPSTLFLPLERLQKINEILQKAVQSTPGTATQNKIKRLTDEMKSVLLKAEQDPMLEQISMSAKSYYDQPLSNQEAYGVYNAQVAYENARLQVLKKHGVFDIFEKNQKLIVEELFKAKATPEQKKEYERRKACLNAPLF